MKYETEIKDPFQSFQDLLDETTANSRRLIKEHEAILCNLPESDAALRIATCELLAKVVEIEMNSKLMHSAFIEFQRRVREILNETSRRTVTIDWQCPQEADDITKIRWAVSTLRKVCMEK